MRFREPLLALRQDGGSADIVWPALDLLRAPSSGRDSRRWQPLFGAL